MEWKSVILAGGVVLSLAGCLSRDQGRGSRLARAEAPPVELPDEAPRGRVRQVRTVWTEACIHDGDVPVTQGYTCKLYLFGPDSLQPVVTPGKFTFYAFDKHNKVIEPERVWEFTAEEAAAGVTEDPFGWGYTFFLAYGPPEGNDRTRSLLVKFVPEVDPMPLLSEFALVTMPGVKGSLVRGKVVQAIGTPEDPGAAVILTGAVVPVE